MNYYGAKNMADSWRTVRKNTIQVAEEIPEDKYSFKAAADTRSVAEMLAHIAAATHWADQLHYVDKKNLVGMEDFGRWGAEAGQMSSGWTTKAAIIEALKARGEAFAHRLESTTEAQLGEHVSYAPPIPGPGKSRFEMLLGVKEHEMHHRGQLNLIQRMLGIVPHLTRARQQRS